MNDLCPGAAQGRARTPKRIFEISDELTQAFRRLALRGNSHWVSYYSSDGVPGRNDRQASKGHVTSTGRDTRRDAGKPFWFTQPVIDERRLGFGFWTRSDRGEDSTYGFACFDIEPISQEGGKRVDREPTAAKAKEVLVEAIQVFLAWKRLAATRAEIVWVLLVESSPGHFHVWAVFARPLTEAEHDGLVDEAARLHPPLIHLDKSSKRGRGRFGDQFRSPWSWKKGRRSEALASWIRDGDEEALVRLAERCPPANARAGRVASPGPASAPREHDPAGLAEHAIARFPVRGAGELNRATGLLVADLANRGVPERAMTQAGDAWLEYYESAYATEIEAARQTLRRTIRRTLDNPRFRDVRPTEYRSLVAGRVMSADQRRSLTLASPDPEGGVNLPYLGRGVAVPERGAGCSPYPRGEEEQTKWRRKGEQPERHGEGEQPGPLAPLLGGELQALVLEAIVILSEVELAKPGARPWTVAFTHRQVFDAIGWRHPGYWPEDVDEAKDRVRDVTFRRFKKKFASFNLTPVKGRSPIWHEAEGLEILREVRKGTPGLASVYEVVGPLRGVLISGGLVGEDGLCRAAT